MPRLIHAFFLLVLALVLAACMQTKRDKGLDETLRDYEQMIRWSQWDGAANMLSPESLQEHPITNLDMERLRLFKVTQYIVRSAAGFDDGAGWRQTVEIRLFNKTRAQEKIVMDQQEWRYEEISERWLLHSGLPDVSKRY